MHTLADLELTPLWVNPKHSAATAGLIAQGHRARAVGVLEGESLVGVLPRERAVSPNLLVCDVMLPVTAAFQAGEDIRDVAKQFAIRGLDYAVVLEGERFAGIVTAAHLLGSLGRSYDPLTKLSWSDELRAWSLENLRAGREVTILFVDIDQFGAYNKRFGHVVGDRVLQAVAKRLGAKLDRATDILVRYGGDEFAIGTIRTREEADLLAKELPEPVSISPEVEAAQFSVGVFGGRRTKERDNVHFASTVDNLINMASRAAIAAKAEGIVRNAVAPGSTVEAKPYRVVSVHVDRRGDRSVATVILEHGDSIISGSEVVRGGRAEESVISATVKALARDIPDVALNVEALTLFSVDEETVVHLKGAAHRRGAEFPVLVQRRSKRGSYLASAESAIEALAELA